MEGKEITRYINERAEFEALAARTDARKQRAAETAISEAKRRDETRRAQDAQRKRTIRSLWKVAYGILSACLALNAYLAWHSSEPELCVFPAALAALVAWAGVTE